MLNQPTKTKYFLRSSHKISALLAFISLMTISLYANDVLKTEIDHLLNYLKNQKGEFIRNGKSHTPEKAVEHIIKKYNHHKKEITTTEKFIELCASKSILSGKPYEYKNEKGESTEVSALLTKALKEFRDPPKK